jgi:VCBS repeat-containing protein
VTTFIVNTSADETYNAGDLAGETADGSGLSLREALALAQNGDTITFDASLSGGSVLHTLGTELLVTTDITIDGDLDNDGTPDVTIDLNNTAAAYGIHVDTGGALTLDGVTLTGMSTAQNRTAIHTETGTSLDIQNSIITGNGGSISVNNHVITANGNVSIEGSRFENNDAATRILYVNNGSLTINDSSFTGNSSANRTIATGNNLPSATITNTTIANNGTYGADFGGHQLTLTNVTMTGHSGADLYLFNTSATITDSIIAGGNTSIHTPTGYSLTFSGTNVVANLSATYSGDAPTIEADLNQIFDSVGTLSLYTLPSGAQVYAAYVNPTGVAQGLGAAFPATIGGDTTGSISEDGTTVSGSLTISDPNGTAEESFDADTLTGSYGELDIAANGDWTYTVDGADSAVDGLDVGDTLTDTLTATSADGTTQQITVTINGADDAAVVSGTFSGTVSKSDTSTSGTLNISDVDGDDSPSFADVASVAGDNGHGQFVLTSGTWTYVADASVIGGLGAGETLTDTYTFVASDSTAQQVTVTLGGSESPPTRPLLSSDGVAENSAGALVGQLSATDPDGGAVSYSVDDARFRVDGNQLYLKDGVALDYESGAEVTIRVYAEDSHGLRSSSFVSFDVLDVHESVMLPGTGADETLTGSDEADSIWARGGNDQVFAMGGDDRVGGGTGDDTLEGGDGDDSLCGGAGADRLQGGLGNDTLYNGAGDDMVSGGAGDDMLWAGAGDDQLTGGSGADSFVFGASSGNDTITDFNVDEDSLNLAARGFADMAAVEAAASASVQGGESGVLLDLGGGESVFLAGLSVTDIAGMNIAL